MAGGLEGCAAPRPSPLSSGGPLCSSWLGSGGRDKGFYRKEIAIIEG